MPRGMPTPKPTFIACRSEFVVAATCESAEDVSDDADPLGGKVGLPVWEARPCVTVIVVVTVEVSSVAFGGLPGCLRVVKNGSLNILSGEEQQAPLVSPQQALLALSQRVMAT